MNAWQAHKCDSCPGNCCARTCRSCTMARFPVKTLGRERCRVTPPSRGHGASMSCGSGFIQRGARSSERIALRRSRRSVRLLHQTPFNSSPSAVLFLRWHFHTPRVSSSLWACFRCHRHVKNCKDNTSKDPFSQCENLQNLQGFHIQVKS